MENSFENCEIDNISCHTGIGRVEVEKEVVFIKDISVKEILKERKRRKTKKRWGYELA